MTGETVTVQRPGTRIDRGGNNVPDWSDPAEHTITGCAIDPTSSAEAHDARDAVVAYATIYAPAGCDVNAGDRVVVRGETCDVIGEPARYTNPRTLALAGVTFTVRKVAG